MFSMLSIITSYSQQFSDQALFFDVINDGEVAVTGRTDDNFEMTINIPETAIDDSVSPAAIYTVTAVADFAFQSELIFDLTIPNTVVTIGESAFEGISIESLTLPSNLMTIGDYAFASSVLLTINIPPSVAVIGDFAFFGSTLNSVTISEGVTAIGASAFAENALESLIIPESVTTIGASAFFSNLLSSVIIPEGVTTIGASAFAENDLLMVESLSTNPAQIVSGTFSSLLVDKIDLEIPPGTMQSYIDNGWTDFNIVEDVSLSITDLEVSLQDSIDIVTSPNEISVESKGNTLINIQQLDVYAISGIKVATSTSSNVFTESMANGIYILNVITDKGNLVKKIVK